MMDRVQASSVRRAAQRQAGQAMVEAAIAFPVLVMLMLGLVQFALYVHAQNVVTGAVQDGARVASVADGSLSDGVARAQILLRAGLGADAGTVTVSGAESGDAVTVVAQGRLHLIIPWVMDATLPLQARATVEKERFHAGPGQ